MNSQDRKDIKRLKESVKTYMHHGVLVVSQELSDEACVHLSTCAWFDIQEHDKLLPDETYTKMLAIYESKGIVVPEQLKKTRLNIQIMPSPLQATFESVFGSITATQTKQEMESSDEESETEDEKVNESIAAVVKQLDSDDQLLSMQTEMEMQEVAAQLCKRHGELVENSLFKMSKNMRFLMEAKLIDSGYYNTIFKALKSKIRMISADLELASYLVGNNSLIRGLKVSEINAAAMMRVDSDFYLNNSRKFNASSAEALKQAHTNYREDVLGEDLFDAEQWVKQILKGQDDESFEPDPISSVGLKRLALLMETLPDPVKAVLTPAQRKEYADYVREHKIDKALKQVTSRKTQSKESKQDSTFASKAMLSKGKIYSSLFDDIDDDIVGGPAKPESIVKTILSQGFQMYGRDEMTARLMVSNAGITVAPMEDKLHIALPSVLKRMRETKKVFVLDVANLVRNKRVQKDALLSFVDILNNVGITVIGSAQNPAGLEQTVMAKCPYSLHSQKGTHDDLVGLELARRYGCIIITKDTFQEFKENVTICQTHSTVLVRKGDQCPYNMSCSVKKVSSMKVQTLVINELKQYGAKITLMTGRPLIGDPKVFRNTSEVSSIPLDIKAVRAHIMVDNERRSLFYKQPITLLPTSAGYYAVLIELCQNISLRTTKSKIATVKMVEVAYNELKTYKEGKKEESYIKNARNDLFLEQQLVIEDDNTISIKKKGMTLNIVPGVNMKFSFQKTKVEMIHTGDVISKFDYISLEDDKQGKSTDIETIVQSQPLMVIYTQEMIANNFVALGVENCIMVMQCESASLTRITDALVKAAINSAKVEFVASLPCTEETVEKIRGVDYNKLRSMAMKEGGKQANVFAEVNEKSLVLHPDRVFTIGSPAASLFNPQEITGIGLSCVVALPVKTSGTETLITFDRPVTAMQALTQGEADNYYQALINMAEVPAALVVNAIYLDRVNVAHTFNQGAAINWSNSLWPVALKAATDMSKDIFDLVARMVHSDMQPKPFKCVYAYQSSDGITNVSGDNVKIMVRWIFPYAWVDMIVYHNMNSCKFYCLVIPRAPIVYTIASMAAGVQTNFNGGYEDIIDEETSIEATELTFAMLGQEIIGMEHIWLSIQYLGIVIPICKVLGLEYEPTVIKAMEFYLNPDDVEYMFSQAISKSVGSIQYVKAADAIQHSKTSKTGKWMITNTNHIGIHNIIRTIVNMPTPVERREWMATMVSRSLHFSTPDFFRHVSTCFGMAIADHADFEAKVIRNNKAKESFSHLCKMKNEVLVSPVASIIRSVTQRGSGNNTELMVITNNTMSRLAIKRTRLQMIIDAKLEQTKSLSNVVPVGLNAALIVTNRQGAKNIRLETDTRRVMNTNKISAYHEVKMDYNDRSSYWHYMAQLLVTIKEDTVILLAYDMFGPETRDDKPEVDVVFPTKTYICPDRLTFTSYKVHIRHQAESKNIVEISDEASEIMQAITYFATEKITTSSVLKAPTEILTMLVLIPKDKDTTMILPDYCKVLLDNKGKVNHVIYTELEPKGRLNCDKLMIRLWPYMTKNTTEKVLLVMTTEKFSWLSLLSGLTKDEKQAVIKHCYGYGFVATTFITALKQSLASSSMKESAQIKEAQEPIPQAETEIEETTSTNNDKKTPQKGESKKTEAKRDQKHEKEEGSSKEPSQPSMKEVENRKRARIMSKTVQTTLFSLPSFTELASDTGLLAATTYAAKFLGVSLFWKAATIGYSKTLAHFSVTAKGLFGHAVVVKAAPWWAVGLSWAAGALSLALAALVLRKLFQLVVLFVKTSGPATPVLVLNETTAETS